MQKKLQVKGLIDLDGRNWRDQLARVICVTVTEGTLGHRAYRSVPATGRKGCSSQGPEFYVSATREINVQENSGCQ